MMEEQRGHARLNLHRLELVGFKSFPEKTDIVFHPGITGIVGPNGCGKSNIGDAIAWVLGEQSAKSLRGEKMEDVIFSGTEKREPFGMVQVSLTLRIPAAEQKELVVGRRLFRDGESQYFMNGAPCRLRDIQDTIFDTGMGTRSYFLIEQGRIGEILRSKPTDRRLLIEEAAGISKYRAKRHAAELKLESARQNLERIRDIVAEVRKQMNSLKRQAALARRYERLANERDRLQKLLIVVRFRQLSAELDEAERTFQRARQIELELQAKVSESELDVERGDLNVMEVERVNEEMRSAVYDSKLAVQNAESEVTRAKAQKENIGVLLDQNRRQIEVLSEKTARLRATLAERVREIEGIRSDLVTAEESVQGVGRQFRECEVEAERQAQEVQSGRVRLREAGVMGTSVKNDLLSIAAEKSKLEGIENRLVQEQDRLRSRIGELEARIEQAGAESRIEEEDLSIVVSALNELAEREREERSSLAAAEAHLARIDHLRAISSTRQEALTTIERGRALIPESIRAVLSRYEGQVPARGVLSDFVEVTDPSLVWAAENCMRAYLSAIVLDAATDLPRVIETITEPGAITYLPLDIISAGPAPLSLPPCPTLGESVRIDPALPGLAALLEGVYVVDSLEEALELRRSYPGSAFAVRKDGACLLASGAVLAGNPAQKEESILWIKTELRRLQAELTALDGEREPLVLEVDQRRQVLEALAAQLADLRTRQAEREKAAMLARQRASQTSAEKADSEDHLATIAVELRQAGEEKAEAAARQADLERSIAAIDREVEELSAEAEEREKSLAGHQETRSALRETLTRREAARDALRVKLESGEAETRRIEGEIQDLELEAQRLVEEIRLEEGQLAGLDEARVALEEQIVGRIRELQAKETDLSARETHLAGLRDASASRHESLKGIRAEYQRAVESRSQAELVRAEKGRDLAHLRTASLEEFRKSPEDVAAEIAAPTAVETRRGAEDLDEGIAEERAAEPAAVLLDGATVIAAELEARKADLERMGPINLRAMEDYGQAKDRFEFLSGQERDLLASIESTTEAIKQMDREGRERFREAFEAINRNFSEIFRSLFGGGAADMKLMEADDVLESGIEITAQPPGKKHLSLFLLSGGEKALTAMALLFAIFQYKPSPFCIMDEVDAPLDEPNTDRFLRLLEAYCGRTQFIVVTHNVRTMQAASTLYGITMEERGVSKLVSVKMREPVPV